MSKGQPPRMLTVTEQEILAHWSVQAFADQLRISEDEALEALEAAYAQGRVAIMGTDMFAGVQVDGRWLFVEGRANLARAAHEYATLRFLERQFGE
jgi:hypothetical protein